MNAALGCSLFLRSVRELQSKACALLYPFLPDADEERETASVRKIQRLPPLRLPLVSVAKRERAPTW